MIRLLLDANLSPKVGKFLTRNADLDVISLHGMGLGAIPDHEVIALAKREQRIVVTLDRDFAEYCFRSRDPAIGIIYLNLSISYRYIREINKILERFFNTRASSFNLSECLIILKDDTFEVIHSPTSQTSGPSK